MEYVDLIIDNSSDATDRLYTYGSELSALKPGDKVAVPFSQGNRRKDAFVHSIVKDPENEIKGLKFIIDKDEEISLPVDGIEVCDWMHDRYFCRRIDAVKCFSPSGKRPKRARKINSSPERNVPATTAPKLTGEQVDALQAILPVIEKKEHRVFLLHGVTSSGKTEIYLRIIEECIAQERTAIMLVPEIALTTQTIERFAGRFGEEAIAVLHSKLSLGERYDQWMHLRNGLVPIAIGARSAVFAPLDNIGAIIVDEEHETSYKSDMTPKYDTIEVAIKRASIQGAVVVLGSATPSMESLYRVEQGLYQRIRLTERFNQTPLPMVDIIDMREELKKGNKSIFSLDLYHGIEEGLAAGKQSILFLNRRGYSTFLSCRTCGYVMRCDSCDISMTYHKTENEAVCHYCGRKEQVPSSCPQCKSKYIKFFGTGTEKVEEAAKDLFPSAVIERLDMDTAKKKGSADEILRRFAAGKTHILIGTQLVAKGLDFANVSLVGIISADISLNIPDYRSPERTYQLITQAAGRAGRGDVVGRVVIQTYTPSHYAILAAARKDQESFYREELTIRSQIGYPPFSDLIRLVLGVHEEAEAEEGAIKIRDLLLRKVGISRKEYILGPRPAPMSKINGLYRYQILIKCQPGEWELYQKALWEIRAKIGKEKKNEWAFSIDVNPFGFM